MIMGVHRYMTHKHTGDSPLAWPVVAAGAGAANTPLPNAFNGPIAFELHPTGANRSPGVAIWAAPGAHDRLDFSPLLRRIRAVAGANRNRNRILGQNLSQRYCICEGCNHLMTQGANMRYHLGITNSRAQNTNGCIIPRGRIRVRPAQPGAISLENAYGNWTIDMTGILFSCIPFLSVVHRLDLFSADFW
jgi:hypothetical protein